MFAALLIPCACLQAQTAAAPAAATEPESEDVLVLSPFEVSADAIKGYSAATTLAGNRLKTELRDVGSAIQVVTPQFLKDTGATNSQTLLQYTTNTEVGGLYGNFAGFGNAAQLNEDTIRPNENTRIRGLAAADNTRDYFRSDIPWDAYNVDRVDQARGPNAILFGFGSAGGIVNTSTKQADLNTGRKDELSFAVGSWDRYRGTAYDSSVQFAEVIHHTDNGISRSRTFVIIGLVIGVIFYGVVLTSMVQF